MRTECTALITDGLSYVSESINVLWLTVGLGTITGNKKAIMNYINYDTAIMQKYNVRLDGWPATITFASPHHISTIDEIRLLRHHLLEKTCKWVGLTREEIKRHMDEYAANVRDGAVTGRKRKVRSDKGKLRKKQRAAVEDEDDGEDNAEDENEDNDKVGGTSNLGASRRSLRTAKYKSQLVVDGDSADGSDGTYEDD
jgi:hypothetical protein